MAEKKFELYKEITAVWCSRQVNALYGQNVELLNVKLGDGARREFKTLCYKPEGRGFDFQWGHYSQYGPRLDSESNRNEYQ